MTSKEALDMIEKYFSITTTIIFGDGKDIEIKNAIKFIEEQLDELDKMKKDLQYLANNEVKIFNLPNNKILGIDITNSPSEVEIKKKILKDIIKKYE